MFVHVGSELHPTSTRTLRRLAALAELPLQSSTDFVNFWVGLRVGQLLMVTQSEC